MTTILGCDISGWQSENPDFGNMQFVYVKVTQGLSAVNTEHNTQVANARAKGLIVGHYHFPAWGNPVAEARAFVAAAGWREGDFVVLDIENSGATPWPADPVNWCATWEREVNRLLRIWPLDYLGPYNRRAWNWAPLAACGGGLISPEYNPVGPSAPAPWTFVAMWQNADTNVTGGDSDVFFGDRETLIKYGTPTGSQPAPVPAPHPGPAPAPHPAPAPAPGAGPTIWNVTAGDNCSAIAAAVGVSLAALLTANPGINANLIHPGQVLRLPAGAHWPGGAKPAPHPAPAPVRPAPTVWIVDPGDTMTTIAQRSGVSLASLEAANPGINYNVIHPGQRLHLPAGAHW